MVEVNKARLVVLDNRLDRLQEAITDLATTLITDTLELDGRVKERLEYYTKDAD